MLLTNLSTAVIDVTLAVEDANSKLVDVDAFAYVDIAMQCIGESIDVNLLTDDGSVTACVRELFSAIMLIIRNA